MVFSSIIFMFLYLPVVLGLYYITPRKYRNLLLFVVNLIFYGWGEPTFILLMIASTLINYISGLLIGFFQQKKLKTRAKVTLVASIVLNLALIVFFKYIGLLGETLNIIFPFLNVPILEIPLPIGISFYTFQSMSYTIDVYRHDAKAQKNYITFGTYVALFPQLVAGPIVRYRDVEEQLTSRHENITQFNEGVKIFLVGLSKKVLIANAMGSLWDTLRNTASVDVLGSWVGIIAYTFQIYFDFSGYSDMAIGLGKMFGFEFLKNFDYPYISKSITEFWRRWHISLSTWFKEYIYIPLGGNRKGFPRQVFNMFVVWALTGLWHGASYNFILWGLYFFVILFIEKLFLLKLLQKAPAFVGHIYSLILIVFGWLIFYFEDMGAMGDFLICMFNFGSTLAAHDTIVTVLAYLPLLIIAAVASTPLIHKIYSKLSKKSWRWAVDSVCACAALLLCTASLASSTYNPFLYFKF